MDGPMWVLVAVSMISADMFMAALLLRRVRERIPATRPTGPARGSVRPLWTKGFVSSN